MMFNEEEGKELKSWVIKKLEDISDADSDVLADYVLALLKTDTHELQLRASVVTNLEDFLKDNTETFVDEVLLAVVNKSYLSDYKPTVASFTASTTSPNLATDAPFSAPRGPQQGRKRSFNQAHDGRFDGQNGRGDRPKFLRRGDGGRGGHGRGGISGGFQPGNLPLSMSPPAAMPDFMRGLPGMPPFDSSDPLALMLSMQAMGLPGLPQMPLSTSPNPQGGKNTISAPCRDYETKGFCTRGTSCPFDHGNDRILIPSPQDEYDPKTPNFADSSKLSFPTNGHSNSPFSNSPLTSQARGRDNPRTNRGNFNPPRRNNNRAEFSSTGPNLDRSLTTVVVEQIPEDYFSDESVRAFFSDFGPIDEVTMKAYKRLAIVKFHDYASAVAAYESPKVIFDNRFVKVYWYKPDQEATKRDNANGTPTRPAGSSPGPKSDEPMFDKEKFERDSLAAQKRLEEKKARLKEAEEKRQELEKQTAELARKQEDEKRKLLEKLKAKGRSTDNVSMIGSDLNGASNGTGAKSPKSAAKDAQTEKLRATLAALEAEAKSLGMDPNAPVELLSTSYRGRGRGRGRGGSYRGWEGFANGGRGGYRGRGGGMSFRGGAYNLDNRTKRVKVEGAVFDADRDEGLRSFLMSFGEYEAISPIDESDPTGPQVVPFKDRQTAERFFYGQKDLPGVGIVEFSWVNTPASASTRANTTKNEDRMEGLDDAHSGMAEEHLPGSMGYEFINPRGGAYSGDGGAEVDYDVAEENAWEVS